MSLKPRPAPRRAGFVFSHSRSDKAGRHCEVNDMNIRDRYRREEVLSRKECVERLVGATLARVVFSLRCLPASLPVRIVLADPEHLVLTSPFTQVAGAANHGDVLTVEVDGVDSDGSLWVVMASGIGTPTVVKRELDRDALRASANISKLVSVPMSLVHGYLTRVGVAK
jgi:hypothetical protein